MIGYNQSAFDDHPTALELRLSKESEERDEFVKLTDEAKSIHLQVEQLYSRLGQLRDRVDNRELRIDLLAVREATATALCVADDLRRKYEAFADNWD